MSDDDHLCQRCHERPWVFKTKRIKADYETPGIDGPYPDEAWEDVWVCWRCDHDMINGGEHNPDPVELHFYNEERDYEDDPINNPRPKGRAT